MGSIFYSKRDLGSILGPRFLRWIFMELFTCGNFQFFPWFIFGKYAEIFVAWFSGIHWDIWALFLTPQWQVPTSLKCDLPPGSWEYSVQFYWHYRGTVVSFENEKSWNDVKVGIPVSATSNAEAAVSGNLHWPWKHRHVVKEFASPWTTAWRFQWFCSRHEKFMITIRSCKPGWKSQHPNKSEQTDQFLSRDAYNTCLAGSLNLFSHSPYFSGSRASKSMLVTIVMKCNLQKGLVTQY